MNTRSDFFLIFCAQHPSPFNSYIYCVMPRPWLHQNSENILALYHLSPSNVNLVSVCIKYTTTKNRHTQKILKKSCSQANDIHLALYPIMLYHSQIKTKKHILTYIIWLSFFRLCSNACCVMPLADEIWCCSNIHVSVYGSSTLSTLAHPHSFALKKKRRFHLVYPLSVFFARDGISFTNETSKNFI